MTLPPSSPIATLDVPPGAARLLLVGGTFDPPHATHRDMALAARAFLDGHGDAPAHNRQSGPGPDHRTQPTHIVFVPAARSPFKPPPVASDELRIEMVRAMASQIPGAGVWTDEIDRAAGAPTTPSYWVDTLERAHRAIVPAMSERSGTIPDLRFVIGADQAISLHRWRGVRRVLELARPVIVLRPPVRSADLLRAALLDARFWCEGEIEYLSSRIAPTGLKPTNSTAIRAALAAQSPTPPPELPDEVMSVLARTNPYASG